MKLKILGALLICIISTHAQNYFKLGVENFKKENYVLADTFFTKQLIESPGDKNVRYNRAIVSLILKDTCTFCHDMWNISHTFNDSEAANLYYLHCGQVDTLFYNNSYLPTDKEHCRYYEIIEHNKYFAYITGEVKDKKNNNRSSIITAGVFPPIHSNIIASYKIDGDTSKVYSFTLSPPKFPGDDEAEYDYIKHSPYFKQAMTELKLYRLSTHCEYVVDKSGRTGDFKLLNTGVHIKEQVETFKGDMERLTYLTKMIVLSMPEFTPGKFRDKNVDYLVEVFIDYWGDEQKK